MEPSRKAVSATESSVVAKIVKIRAAASQDYCSSGRVSGKALGCMLIETVSYILLRYEEWSAAHFQVRIEINLCIMQIQGPGGLWCVENFLRI